MKVEQYVMAYLVEQDRLRAILPEGFKSLRPVLRINAEIRNEKTAYLEFNTPVEKDGFCGWLNIGNWENVPFHMSGDKTIFENRVLNISFEKVGIRGGCPAEKDNDGCIFLEETPQIRRKEEITENKEFCDCSFAWIFDENAAYGVSVGKTIPAFAEDEKHIYPKAEFTVQNAAMIPCRQVLGTYAVTFERNEGK